MTEESKILSQSVVEFTAATAAKSPTPGGGSVAGVVGALGVALGEMSLNFTRGKKKFADHAETHAEIGDRLNRAREMFLDLVDDDIIAYGMYDQAVKLPDGNEKDQAMQLALAGAIDVPRQAAKLALAVQGDLLRLADICNPYLLSDLIAAGVLASAAVVLCDLNVRVNTPHLTDPQAAKDIQTASTADRARAAELALKIEETAVKYLPGN